MLQAPQAHFVERIRCINCGSTNLRELSSGRYSDEPLNGFLAADPWGEDPLPFLQTAIWSLVKCRGCSQVFHRRILDEQWNERRFTHWMSEDAIRTFEALLGDQYRRRFRSGISHVEHILRIDHLTSGNRIGAVRLLDFGCGFGRFLEACNHFGFEAYGVDRSIGRRSGSSIKIYPSLDDLPVDRFDAITLFEVLEHLDDPSSVLKTLISRLNPGGILVLETPDCSDVSDIKTKDDYYLIHPLEHINAFTHLTLTSIAERQGLRLIGRPAAVVVCGIQRSIRRTGRYALNHDGKSTQLYFRN